jgi:hypothetical protein
MNARKNIALAATLTLFAGAASAQDSLLDYVITACETDLEAYCATVTPGSGRLLHCVAAHEDKISGECGYALYEAAVLLEELTMAIAYLAENCGDEIESLCSAVEMGEGRVLDCLEANRSALGESCAAALDNGAGS